MKYNKTAKEETQETKEEKEEAVKEQVAPTNQATDVSLILKAKKFDDMADVLSKLEDSLSKSLDVAVNAITYIRLQAQLEVVRILQQRAK